MQNDPDKLAADANTVLQIRGAMKQIRHAKDAIAASLRLGGELRSPDENVDMQNLLMSIFQLQVLGIVLAYRHKMPFELIAKTLDITDEKALLRLLWHFQNDSELAHHWMAAELQRRLTPGESMADRFPGVNRP